MCERSPFFFYLLIFLHSQITRNLIKKKKKKKDIGVYPTYETQAQNEAETMQDPNAHLSWSFHPSDQSIYAQDIGGDIDYDMGHYPNFGGDHTLGGPSNATVNGGVTASGNTPAGGPPSQSPEQVPVSHALNEAFNTQSTATMATTQPFGDAQANSQLPSDAPANAQLYASNDYTIPSGGDGMNYAAQPYYPQGTMDPNAAMWGGPMDNGQAYYGWQMHPQHQQGSGHKPHFNGQRNFRRRKFQHGDRTHRGPKQHWFGGDAERGAHHTNNDNQASSRKKTRYPKKKFPKKGNFVNYRTKEHGFAAQNNNNNNNNNNNVNNETDTKNNNVTNAASHQHQHHQHYQQQQQQHIGDGNANAKQLQQQAQDHQAIDREENKEKELPKSFEALTLSGWFIAIESLGPQHLDKFQTQLLELSPVSLKSFRLEIPSSPVQSSWVNRVQWAQLGAFLSQANLEHVVISRLQPKVEHYNDQDFEELQPVAKFVSALKCKCLVLECAPCKITPEFVQSLSDHIEELKLLCPSVQWNVDMVRALSPKLSYLGLICPNSITIQEFLDTLGDKTQKLCLYNDESSPRKLSPEELDGSLLTEIHPTPETTKTKIEALIIRLKDEVPEKDFYEKHSLPKSIIRFKVCPIDSSSITKRWNANAYEDSKLNVNHGSAIRAQNTELGYHPESTQRAKREPVYEDNKATPNALQQTQNLGTQQTQTDGKKMNFIEKVKSSQKNIKKNPLRIGGQTL
ncbi:hypothetical protein RFI_26485 [Reticulomyxa filosa]|uniref:Uncharacterized protein n=1 Tax=Reticulomyxa filosa TaxID=46433 RepID=X6MB78_RETFI|nr:hypothetical protein RFI_26485 [Reticulomyxa filosa]|eukprot:ETO10891.1 hypothetical protein RFI_26485 [Reticulomyxa filosa]